MQDRIACDDIDVCMIVYNDGPFLRHSLPSIRSTFSSLNLLDMGSTDESIELAHDYFDDIKVTQFSRKLLLSEGFASARNSVSKIATRPWLLHVDADEFLRERKGNHIQITRKNEFKDVFRVERKNIIFADKNIDSNSFHDSEFDVSSIEQHARLYKNTPDFSWRGYLHEELVSKDKEVTHQASYADISLLHLSDLRPFEGKINKERLYAWMLINARNDPELGSTMQSAYIGDFVDRNYDKLRDLANDFKGDVS